MVDDTVPQDTATPSANPISNILAVRSFIVKCVPFVAIIIFTGLFIFLLLRTVLLTQRLSVLQSNYDSLLLATQKTEEMGGLFESDNFTINYPTYLHPLVSSDSAVVKMDYYLDEYHAQKAEDCIKSDSGNILDPCGFGTRIYSLRVHLNPKDKNSSVSWLFGNSNKLKSGSVVDTKGRTWTKYIDLPVTGSITFENSLYVGVLGDRDVVVEIEVPYYSYTRVDPKFQKAILSSFKLK